MARQGFANAKFEVGSDDGMSIAEEFYHDGEDEQSTQQHIHDVSQVQDLQKGLQQSVRAVN